MQHMVWDDLRFILAAARSQTIAEAARRLAVDEATVGRRIARSERQLGARLFERVQGHLVLTDTGRSVAERAERIENEIATVMEETSGVDDLAVGRVRVTSVPIVINHILVPTLRPFLIDHPGLQLDLVAEVRNLSLMKRETDIAVRLARPNREMRALAQRIGYLDYAAYSANHPNVDCRWVTYDDMMADLPQAKFIAERVKASETNAPAVRVNDAETLIRIVQEGLGKSLIATAVADSLPGLVRCEEPLPALRREVWLLLHPELAGLRRIRVVVDWISKTIGELPRPELGRRPHPIADDTDRTSSV
jgi:DNA-binding transcriptional LysR family regulator